MPERGIEIDRIWAMQVFVRVAECGSFSRAAETLDLSNGTVTTCVRKLEKHLGVTLIDRDTRRLRLTEQGLTYVQRCREVLEPWTVPRMSCRPSLAKYAGGCRWRPPSRSAAS
jgi:LysR family transcriptional regulator for bpeEF and oprC